MHSAVMDNRVEERDAFGGPAGAEGPAGSAEQLMIAVEQLVRHVTEPARAEGVSQPGMTQLVGRLERAGLVARNADRSDGRGVLVEITGTGLDVFRQRRAERAHALRELVQELTEPEQWAVRLALPALARAIEGRRARD
ncbi:MarR family transcriptional regulator [Streptomyces sp. NPDC056660]|uniref:MarR family transcriptional regulator n=1 Tax=Streptomyces sp. NPDC056660 TaxID=3345897 RepID=UPI0036AC0A4E